LDSALPKTLEGPWRLHQAARLGKRDRGLRTRGWSLAVHLCQFGLGVESVDVGHPAVHEEENDAFGFGDEVRPLGRERPRNTFADIFPLSSFGGDSEERQIAEPAACVHQKLSARKPQPMRHEWIRNYARH